MPESTLKHKPLSRTKQPAKIPIKTHFSADIYSRLTRMQVDKGLPNPQDLIRLAVSALLEQSGYHSSIIH